MMYLGCWCWYIHTGPTGLREVVTSAPRFQKSGKIFFSLSYSSFTLLLIPFLLYTEMYTNFQYWDLESQKVPSWIRKAGLEDSTNRELVWCCPTTVQNCNRNISNPVNFPLQVISFSVRLNVSFTSQIPGGYEISERWKIKYEEQISNLVPTSSQYSIVPRRYRKTTEKESIQWISLSRSSSFPYSS